MVLPEADDGFQYQFLNNDDWHVATSTLTARDGEFYLHLGFRKESPMDDVEESPAEDRTVLGVDLGINHLAVTSTARFEPGKKLVHERDCFEQTRGGLQKTGTQSAHRTLVRMEGREERYYRDKLHRVSNAIIDEPVEHDCTHIVFEDLRYIRKRISNGKKFQQWAPQKLVQYVEYKAEERGIRVEFVNPRYTSQRCSECGHTSKGNRTGTEFECEKCGKELHADYNAAKNVGWRFVRRGLNDSRRTGDSQLALKSGTVKPNRGFAPYPDYFGSEAESTDKPRVT
nr:transposase [Natronolimnobius sp. AArcel1]